MKRYLFAAFSLFLIGTVSCVGIDLPDEPKPFDIMIDLSGAEVVVEGGAGAPEGTGKVNLVISADKMDVCWDITFGNIDAPNAAHIHLGDKGLNGEAVFTFEPFPKGCTTLDMALAERMLMNPMGYYIDVHTNEFPAGAIRGQLMQ